MSKEPQISTLQKSIQEILEVPMKQKRKRFSHDDFNKNHFCKIIENMEFMFNTSMILAMDFSINLGRMNEVMFETIDMLLEMNFNETQIEIINFYLYGRKNNDGSINSLIDTKTEEPVIMDTPEDLWWVIQEIK